MRRSLAAATRRCRAASFAARFFALCLALAPQSSLRSLFLAHFTLARTVRVRGRSTARVSVRSTRRRALPFPSAAAAAEVLASAFRLFSCPSHALACSNTTCFPSR